MAQIRTKPRMRPDQTLLLAASAVALASWFVEPLRFVLIPLIYLNTHLHELGHAAAAFASGGLAQAIYVYGDGSGQTPVMGGNALLVASSGYVGTALLGGLFIALTGNERGARQSLFAMGVSLGLSMLFLVRGDGIGLASGLFWTAVAFASAKWMKGQALMFLARFLGVQLCLTSAEAFASLYAASSAGLHSDAAILAGLSGIPPLVWASGWLILSLAIVVASLRRAWRSAA